MSPASTLRYVDLPRDELPRGDVSPKELGVLHEVNRRVAAGRSIEELIEYVFGAIRPSRPTDRLSLSLVEEGGLRIVSRCTAADYEPVLLAPGYAADLRHSSLQAVIERGVPRIIGDLRAYLDAHPDSAATRLILKEGVRSSLTCPLSVDDRNVGVLFWSSRRPDAYDERSVRIHQAFAERLSQAVEKAHRIEQLEAANRAYSEMLGFVAHELKSPIAGLVSEAQLLAGGYVGELEPAQRTRVERMIGRGQDLLGLVREYLDLARIEGGLQAEIVPVADFAADVIEPAVEVVEPEMERAGMHLERRFPAEAPAAECDPGLMRIACVNLLGNAVKYGRQGGKVRVTLVAQDDRLSASVWNEGPGFPPDQRSRLFKKFSRLRAPELSKRKGTGVGLYTCWRIVQLHGGRITAHSEPGNWAEFEIDIPRSPVTRGA
jgi:signal transduction histidine kinase